MESTSSETTGKQSKRDKNSIETYGVIVIPELDEILEERVPWDLIDPILISYYSKFAENRQVSKLVEYIEDKFNVKLNKSSVGKRYERIKERGEQ